LCGVQKNKLLILLNKKELSQLKSLKENNLIFYKFVSKKNAMSVIVIRPKNKTEQTFITRLLKKMNVEAQFIEEFIPNNETQKAIEDVENRKGTKVKDSKELFSHLGI